MSDSLPNVELDPQTWVDLNNASGIAAGTALIIQNLSDNEIRVVRKTSGTPVISDGYNAATEAGTVGSWVNTDAGDPTVWAYSKLRAQLNVQDGS